MTKKGRNHKDDYFRKTTRKIKSISKKIKLEKEKIDKRFGHEIIRRLDLDYANLNQKEMARIVNQITSSLRADDLTKNNSSSTHQEGSKSYD
ncbi:hypothetical protein [Leuconostoc mesenteroides]|uniref:hypothetical protein n=1 Tax=Leuconostoc mesenteroides TaxID=1245 RepID=UPI000E08E278|nr:hypothetical protein [Leuconostoc mesenteroides]MCM6826831.1 hypothetical protein [Leuconostoc mesenteroides]RDF90305.1 hypothetical protein DQM09_08895 [Leuconostoc mesenteroides subsp. mesenteroides]